MHTAPEKGTILVVAPEPFYENRGTPIAVRYVLQALSELGCGVDLLTYPPGETINLPGLRTCRVASALPIRQVPIGFSLRKVLLDLFLSRALLRRLRHNRYGCVHAVEEAILPALLFARRRGVPVIYDMQSSLPEQLSRHALFRTSVVQQALLRFERWVVRNADFVVCSAGLGDYVRNIEPAADVTEWRFPALPMETTPVSDCEKLKKALRLSPASRVILYTGNSAAYQGVTKLLDAAKDVVATIPDAVFVLVGTTVAADPTLSGRVSELVGSGVLRLVSQQPRATINRFLAMADVVVSPRESGRNLPLKIFDYMAAGKPIVATDLPSHRAVLHDGLAVLAPLSPVGMAQAIVDLLRDPERAKRLGAAARAYAEKNLEWQPFVELVSAIQHRVRGKNR
jgi:glycosyltransferase involved in cell wall biosynthesis